MASPFPGMDPYLEGERWPGFQHDLATEIKRQLLPSLLPRYYADTSTYFLLDSGEGAFPRKPHRTPHSQAEIRDVQDHRLVTAIEFLSPASKRSVGRKQYLQKRISILGGASHLIEVDLLRHGQRLPSTGELPPASYCVYLSRAKARPQIDVWPIPLSQPLPVIPVPLLPGDADVTLDLQQALTAVYDLSRYELLLDYRADPEVPLSPAEAGWVDQLLTEKGHRRN